MRPLPETVKNYWQKRRVWDRYQEEQDPAIGAMHREQRTRTVAAVREFAAGRPEPVDAADVCCGTGWISHDLMQLERIRSLLAADISAPALARLETRARELGGQAKLRTLCGNLYELDWGSEKSFDVIVCMDALHHLPDIPGMLRNIRHRLKVDGIFIGNIRSSEGAARFFDRYGLVNRVLIGIQPAVDRLLPEKSFVRRWLGNIGYFRILTFTRSEAEQLLTQAGFSVLRLTSDGYHWFVCAPGA
jgi:ubiquinone/menaquinone biosynthesis C-methylase UbiE